MTNNTEEDKNLSDLCHTLDVLNLGEGNINAGFNTLATMACTISNIARPGSGIITEHGNLLRVGTSLLTNGSITCSLVNDHVEMPLIETQKNLTAQIRRILQDKQRQEIDPKRSQVAYPKGPEANSSEQAMYSVQYPQALGFDSIQDLWTKALSNPPNPRLEDLAERPKIIVTATKADELKKHLPGTQLAQPLILLGLRQQSRNFEYSSIGDLITSVMDGKLPDGLYGEVMQGNALISDPENVLPSLILRSNWITRALSLVDGDAGPELPAKSSEFNRVTIGNIPGRYKTALKAAFAKRLNNHNPSPFIKQIPLHEAQINWMKFLQSLESKWQGITGVCRCLLSSLVFGIQEIVEAIPYPKEYKYPLSGIESLARHLVLRAINAREEMVHSLADVQLKLLKQRIVMKLADGRHTPRELTRRFNSLAIVDCREALNELEAEGIVLRQGQTYDLTKPYKENNSNLTLNI